MAKYYFADKAEQCDDLFDFGKCHLGEDRWLTHLFMIGAQERYQIQMNTGAFCKTEAVQTFRSLLKQRRRWFLGFITNEACMLTDIRLWKRYPLLILIRLAQNTIRTTALLFLIMVISIITTSQEVTNLPFGFIAVSLGLNWVLMLYFGAKLGRYKIMLYPLMFVLNPFFNWLYMVYGIFTAGQRTWGGPRADAGRADEKTSPEQAIEKAVAGGDELNVVPETFKPALEATTRRLPHHAPLMPAGHLEGRFAPAEEGPGGWYRQVNDSSVMRPDMTMRRAEAGLNYSKERRSESMDSFYSRASTISTVYMPRRVESIVGFEDAATYHDGQARQRPAGGMYFETPMDRSMPAFSNGPIANKSPRSESLRSYESDSSVSLHFDVPPRGRTMDFTGPGATYSSRISSSGHPHRAGLQRERSKSPRRLTPITLPPVALLPPDRTQRDPSRTGRSPLARRSFTLLATDFAPTTGDDIAGPSDRLPRRHSVAGDGPRGRRSISVDRSGRRRLSKQRPSKRSASQG